MPGVCVCVCGGGGGGGVLFPYLWFVIFSYLVDILFIV